MTPKEWIKELEYTKKCIGKKKKIIHTYDDLVKINRDLKKKNKELKKRNKILKGGNLKNNSYGTVGSLRRSLSQLPNNAKVMSKMTYDWYFGQSSEYISDFKSRVDYKKGEVKLSFDLPSDLSSSLSEQDYNDY